MEVLSDILRSMRVAGSVYFCDRLLAPRARTFDDPTRATFHLVRKGEGCLRADEVEAHLFAADFAFIASGQSLTALDARVGCTSRLAFSRPFKRPTDRHDTQRRHRRQARGA